MENKKVGRLMQRVNLLVSNEMYVELKEILEKSRYNSMNALIRSLLNKDTITLDYYDATMDKVVWELSGIRKELQLIAINMNQATNKLLNEQFPEFVRANGEEIAGMCQELLPKLHPIFEVITKIADIWLPK